MQGDDHRCCTGAVASIAVAGRLVGVGGASSLDDAGMGVIPSSLSMLGMWVVVLPPLTLGMAVGSLSLSSLSALMTMLTTLTVGVIVVGGHINDVGGGAIVALALVVAIDTGGGAVVVA